MKSDLWRKQIQIRTKFIGQYDIRSKMMFRDENKAKPDRSWRTKYKVRSKWSWEMSMPDVSEAHRWIQIHIWTEFRGEYGARSQRGLTINIKSYMSEVQGQIWRQSWRKTKTNYEVRLYKNHDKIRNQTSQSSGSNVE